MNASLSLRRSVIEMYINLTSVPLYPTYQHAERLSEFTSFAAVASAWATTYQQRCDDSFISHSRTFECKYVFTPKCIVLHSQLALPYMGSDIKIVQTPMQTIRRIRLRDGTHTGRMSTTTDNTNFDFASIFPRSANSFHSHLNLFHLFSIDVRKRYLLDRYAFEFERRPTNFGRC